MKIETKLSSLYKFLNKSDIAYVDYTYNKERKKMIKPLNQFFRDKIMVFTLIERRYLSISTDTKGEEIKISNFPKELLGRTTTNIIFAFNHISLPINKQHINPFKIDFIAKQNYIKRTSDFIQMLKVSLDHLRADKVFENLSNSENL